MEISIPSYSQGSPVHYTIHVSLPGHTSYIIKKRYSEFATFSQDIEHEIGERSPIQFPQKKWIGNNNEDFLKERRRRLELYLRGVLKLDEWRDSLAVSKFLETSKHIRAEARNRGSDINLQNATEWAKAVAEVRAMIHQIKGASVPGALLPSSAVSAEERKLQVKARSKLQELEGSLVGDNKLGEGEYMRRRNIVQDLSKALVQIDGTRKTWIMNSIGGESTNTDGVGNNYSNNSISSKRNSSLPSKLFGKNITSGRRVLGSGGETDKTRQLNNAGLLQMHEDEMQSQDQTIEGLRKTLRTQRDLGQQIYEELEFQNKALDDLDNEIHSSNARLNQARRKVKKFQ